MARFRGVISVDIPEGASREDVACYIVSAVAVMKGSLEPPGEALGDGTFTEGNPLFDLDRESIRLGCIIDGQQVEYIDS